MEQKYTKLMNEEISALKQKNLVLLKLDKPHLLYNFSFFFFMSLHLIIILTNISKEDGIFFKSMLWKRRKFFCTKICSTMVKS